MQALIDPNTSVQYVTSWTTEKPYKPIFSTYENSARVCQVEPDDKTFPIGEPLFWTFCEDTIVADEFYYDTVTLTFIPVVNVPHPTTDGVQSV